MSTTLQSPSSPQTHVPTTIAKLTIASSLAGATFTALYESTIGRAKAIKELELKGNTPNAGAKPGGTSFNEAIARYRHRTPLLAASAALNSGLVAFCFFNAREYIIKPTLNELVPKRNGAQNESELTWNAMRRKNVLETAVTGALLGGGFNLRRGLSAMPSGAITAALVATAIQIVSNEVRLQRVKFIASRQRQDDPSSPFTIPEQSSDFVGSPMMSGMSSSVTASPSPTTLHCPDDRGRPSSWERALSFIGIIRVDDAEYLRRLKAKRELHLTRIRELEAQLQDEREKKTN